MTSAPAVVRLHLRLPAQAGVEKGRVLGVLGPNWLSQLGVSLVLGLPLAGCRPGSITPDAAWSGP